MASEGQSQLIREGATQNEDEEMYPKRGCVMVAADPFFLQKDFLTASALEQKLRGYLVELRERVRTKDGTDPPLLVVFPELLGSWLCLEGSGASEGCCAEVLMLRLALKQPFKMIRILLTNLFNPQAHWRGLMGLLQRSLFQLQAPNTLKQYFHLFQALSLEHSCYVVAGSAFLPSLNQSSLTECPQIANSSSLLNTSFSFSPSGELLSITSKSHPVLEELDFLDPAPLEENSPFLCGPFGQVSVLICADSWYPISYQRLFSAPVTPNVIAVPSFSSEALSWNEKWAGYCEGSPPDGVDVSDAIQQEVTLHQAWRRFAVPGALLSVPKLPSQVFMINSFFHGCVLGLHAGGSSVITCNQTCLVSGTFPTLQDSFDAIYTI